MMLRIERVLYTAKARTISRPDGDASRTDDGRLSVTLSEPGSPGNGTNPAQLLAVGWSSCFLSTIKHVAAKSKVDLPANAAIDVEADAGIAGRGLAFQVRMDVQLPGMSVEAAEKLIEAADLQCPFSKATRGNVNVTFACNGALVAAPVA
jgi:lipoyl-dependent peroxiredoxin